MLFSTTAWRWHFILAIPCLVSFEEMDLDVFCSLSSSSSFGWRLCSTLMELWGLASKNSDIYVLVWLFMYVFIVYIPGMPMTSQIFEIFKDFTASGFRKIEDFDFWFVSVNRRLGRSFNICLFSIHRMNSRFCQFLLLFLLSCLCKSEMNAVSFISATSWIYRKSSWFCCNSWEFEE